MRSAAPAVFFPVLDEHGYVAAVALKICGANSRVGFSEDERPHFGLRLPREIADRFTRQHRQRRWHIDPDLPNLGEQSLQLAAVLQAAAAGLRTTLPARMVPLWASAAINDSAEVRQDMDEVGGLRKVHAFLRSSAKVFCVPASIAKLIHDPAASVCRPDALRDAVSRGGRRVVVSLDANDLEPLLEALFHSSADNEEEGVRRVPKRSIGGLPRGKSSSDAAASSEASRDSTPPLPNGADVLGLPFPPRLDDFWHSEDILWSLHGFLGPTTPAPRVAILIGASGCGHTTVAVEYAARLRDAFPGGIFWVTPAGLDASIIQSGGAQRSRSSQLLVIDGVDEASCQIGAAVATELSRVQPGLSILATARVEGLRDAGQIGATFVDRCGWPALESRVPSDKVSALVGGNKPLAEWCCGNALRIVAARHALTKHPEDLPTGDWGAPRSRKDPLVRLCLDAGRNVKRLLRVIYCARGGLDRELMRRCARDMQERYPSLADEWLGIALATAQEHGLMRVDRQGHMHTHAAVEDVTRSWLLSSRDVERTAALLTEMLLSDDANEDLARSGDWAQQTLLDKVKNRHVQCRFLIALARYNRLRLRLVSRAEILARTALRMSPEDQWACVELGLCVVARGDTGSNVEAIELCQVAQTATPGSEHYVCRTDLLALRGALSCLPDRLGEFAREKLASD